MKIKTIELNRVRGFKHLQETELSETINIFIGQNNAGKSTILKSIFLLQDQQILTHLDTTKGVSDGEVILSMIGSDGIVIADENKNPKLVINLSGQFYLLRDNTRVATLNRFSEIEPNNLVYPFFSNRKVAGYSETITIDYTDRVFGNFTALYARVDKLMDDQLPASQMFKDYTKEILGFAISSISSNSGKKPAYVLDNHHNISITSMGDGVPNILGLISDLCLAENKIFLIEELENDIHPKALKALLRLIIEKSKTNQFFISTHSNIVMRYLGAEQETSIFNITSTKSEEDRLFLSRLSNITQDEEGRKQALEDLGYELFDSGLWQGWLFLEEASAETIIRDYLIPWFVPQLNGKLRTFSAGGKSNVTLKFEDFNRLFCFIHLQQQEIYKNKTWVVIDNGLDEEEIITKMRKIYTKSGWNEEHFSQFNEHDFEKYYPSKFQAQCDKILKIKDKENKIEAKKELLNEVKKWIVENKEEAKNEFKKSAKEVIGKLNEIETVLLKNS